LAEAEPVATTAPADAAYPSSEVGRHASMGIVKLGVVTKRFEGEHLALIL
jgi:sorbitol-specific phosphotransferase system component IIA